jgi:hypothetical protein
MLEPVLGVEDKPLSRANVGDADGEPVFEFAPDQCHLEAVVRAIGELSEARPLSRTAEERYDFCGAPLAPETDILMSSPFSWARCSRREPIRRCDTTGDPKPRDR